MTQQAEVKTPADDSVCTVCRGTYAEHYDGDGKAKTRHAFTMLEGDLVTHQQAAKRTEKPRPQVIALPNATQNEGGALNRLIETLLNKEFLTTDEALYVCGIGPKPEPPSGFADPVSPRDQPGLGGSRPC